MSKALWAALGVLVMLMLAAVLLDPRPSPARLGPGWEVAVQVEGRLYPQTICRNPEVDMEHKRIICHRRRVSMGEPF